MISSELKWQLCADLDILELQWNYIHVWFSSTQMSFKMKAMHYFIFFYVCVYVLFHCVLVVQQVSIGIITDMKHFTEWVLLKVHAMYLSSKEGEHITTLLWNFTQFAWSLGVDSSADLLKNRAYIQM